MSGFVDRRQTGGLEQVHPAPLAHAGLLAGCADRRLQPAAAVEVGLHERHAEGAALGTDRVPQTLGFEGDEHELDALGRAAPQDRQQRVDLMVEHGDDDEVEGRALVQRFGDPHVRPLVLDIDDAAVASQLLKPGRARPCHDRDVVPADARQLEREGAADPAGAEHGDPQGRDRSSRHEDAFPREMTTYASQHMASEETFRRRSYTELLQ